MKIGLQKRMAVRHKDTIILRTYFYPRNIRAIRQKVYIINGDRFLIDREMFRYKNQLVYELIAKTIDYVYRHMNKLMDNYLDELITS